MPQKPLAQEEIEAMRQQRSEGSTVEAISEATGRSLGAVSHATRGIKKPSKPKTKVAVPEPEKETLSISPSQVFLDAEAKFNQLLKEYGIKDSSRIVAYASAQGENVYSRLELLKRCLVDQGVAPGKVRAIIKHWAAQEGIPLPERLAGEIPEQSQSAPVRKFSIINDTLMPDAEGEYTFNEALRLISAKSSTSQGGSELKELRTEVATLRESLHQQQLDVINAKVDRLTTFIAESDKRKVGRTELDLMSEGLGKFENIIGLGADKVDRFMRDNKDEKHLLRSLSFGISPLEYQKLIDGQEVVLSREDLGLSRHIAHHRGGSGEEFVGPTEADYQEYVKRVETDNKKYQAISDRVTKKLGQKPVEGEGKKVEPILPKPGDKFDCPSCHWGTEVVEVGSPVHCHNTDCPRSGSPYIPWEEVVSIITAKK